jgi:hypothetical protein
MDHILSNSQILARKFAHLIIMAILKPKNARYRVLVVMLHALPATKMTPALNVQTLSEHKTRPVLSNAMMDILKKLYLKILKSSTSAKNVILCVFNALALPQLTVFKIQ